MTYTFDTDRITRHSLAYLTETGEEDEDGEPILEDPITSGQADDLYLETTIGNPHTQLRYWVSRCGVEDGEPCDSKVTVEALINGRWEEVLCYCGDTLEDC